MTQSLFVIAAILATPVFAQEAAPVAPAAQPVCSAKVTDSCQQTKGQEDSAMTGAEADRRDSRNAGNWTPDGAAGAKATGGRLEVVRGQLAVADTTTDGVLTNDRWVATGGVEEISTSSMPMPTATSPAPNCVPPATTSRRVSPTPEPCSRPPTPMATENGARPNGWMPA
ncbi:hypothetical protein GCM10011529_07130 [Polymorphobacter glacialis]|uniref:Organic solvent tolerance-like N-terminal domain-containing protein n=1 Tax=Sandarakinorhabdus glacialis TaxID=1614636 RepID=A0A916ZMB6_9SPHN|nr:hypothetical protein GCM10011529_07130 [Polymorphobacter glacialis]